MPLEDLVSDYAKGIVIALGPEDGESFWQPLPSTGYVINKINPYNSPYDAFSTGLQALEPAAHIRFRHVNSGAAMAGRTGGNISRRGRTEVTEPHGHDLEALISGPNRLAGQID